MISEADGPLFYQPGIAEYINPAPWVDPSTLDLANHTKDYVAHPKLATAPTAIQPLSNTPQYVYNLGEQKVIVVLADFSDVKHRASNTKSYYDAWINGNTSSDRSLKTYYYENSYGQYIINATVTDWVTLPNTQAWYDANTLRLAGDAAQAANSQVDFSLFDQDGDQVVDRFVVIHAGGDQAVGCSPNCIWSHSGYAYPAVRVDNVYVQPYCTIADFGGSGDQVGVLDHEFGHLALGYPDLYDPNYINAGLGDWDLMAAGAWGGGGIAPSDLSAWSKLDAEWETFYEPTNDEQGYTIYATSDVVNHNPVKINSNYTDEYFLIEFRSRTASARYDTQLPTSGLVIYHVDATAMAQRRGNNDVMYPTSHKAIDIEEVGTQDMDDSPWNEGDSNDVWVSSAAGFTATSTPNSNLYRNGGTYATGIAVYNISAVLSAGGPHMTFDFKTGRVNHGVTARVLGSSDVVAAPGASATFRIEVRTLSSAGDGVTMSLQGTNAGLATIDRTHLQLPPLGMDTVNITVTIPSDWSAQDPAYVDVRAQSDSAIDEYDVAPTTTRAGQVFDISITGSLDVTSPALTPEDLHQVQLTVFNLGNGPDNVTLAANYDPLKVSIDIVNQPWIINRYQSTGVIVTYNVSRAIPYGTIIPISIDAQYGVSIFAGQSSPRHLILYGNITVGKFADLVITVSAAPLTSLTPGANETINLVISNQGNYAADVGLTAVAFQGISVVFDVSSRTVPAFFQVSAVATVWTPPNVAAFTQGTIYFTIADDQTTSTDGAAVQVLQRFQVLLSGLNSGTGLPGTTVNVPLVATNFGNGVDAMRMTIVPAFSEWNPVLSAYNFSLGATTTTSSTNVLFSASIPATAAGNVVQSFEVTLYSQGQNVLSKVTVSVLVLPVYSFTVSSTAAQTGITNSEVANFLISFRNTGNVRDSYSVTVSGLPEGWTTEFAEGEGVATIGPGFTTSLTLLLKPPTTAPAGLYDFQLVASSEGDLAQRKVLLDNVTILSRHEIRVRTTTVDGDVVPGSLVTVRIVVQNMGNVEERVLLTSTGPLSRVTFDPVEVKVSPYGEATATAIILVDDDQAAGYAPLVISAASVANPDVATENTVGITVKSPPAQQSPGVEAAAAVGALAAVAAVAALARRRKL